MVLDPEIVKNQIKLVQIYEEVGPIRFYAMAILACIIFLGSVMIAFGLTISIFGG